MPRRKYCRVLRYKCDVKGVFSRTSEREREREKGKKGSREEMRVGERETELRGTR